MSHDRLMKLANGVMTLAVLVFLAGLTAAFLFDQQLSIGQQIASHAGLLLGATFVKLGYVIRLSGLRQQQLLES